MSTFLLGLDIGTSVTKAALFDESGLETASASRRTDVLQPRPGWSEMDPEAIWRSACEACRAVLEKAGLTGADIAAVGVTGVMIGAWLIDGDGRPLRPAVLWNDGRTQALVDRLRRGRPSLLSDIFASSGSVMQLGCMLPVLAWVSEQEPEILKRAKVALCAKDFIRLRLTGDCVATDETEAAVAPGTAAGRRFAPSLLPLFGLEDKAHLLPEVLASTAVAGTVSAEAAAATGLRPGTPVATGAGDTPASVLGAGAAEPALACTILGTTCLNGLVFDRPVFEPRDLGILFTVPGGRWMKTMVNVAGTTNIDWGLGALCPDLLGMPDAYERFGTLAAGVGPGAGGALYVPYLSHTGIIAPRIEPGARAGFVGLDPSHRREHLVRAVYEGVALSIRDSYAAIGGALERIRLVGGGSRSRFWSQMIADVTGRPVDVPQGSEFGAKGAALLAGVAIGRYATVQEACRETFRLDRSHEPDTVAGRAYDAAFARYRAAREAVIEEIAPAYREAEGA